MARFPAMKKQQRDLWLVVNSAAGSNNEAAYEELERCCGKAGLHVARTVRFPDEPLPSAAELDRAKVGLIGIFTGDGTINTLVTSLYGWGGAVLVLPGGTMNLLCHRLHGEAEMDDILHAAAAGRAIRTRPNIIRCRWGDSLAGLNAGPGTAWNHVREAMRQTDVIKLADDAAYAIGESTGAPMIACVEPKLGRSEGYPLVMLTPSRGGITVRGYHSETFTDFLSQGWALLKRNFRDGPHDMLGTVDHLRLASVAQEGFGLSIDGETKEGGPVEEFRLARCEVDLLATRNDD